MSLAKQIVIVGGGFGGATVGQLLKSKSGHRVTIVNPTPFMFYKLASLRAACNSGVDASNTLIPLTKCADKLVVGKAQSVDDENKHVVLDNGDKLSYDALVIATGTTNGNPGALPSDVNTLEGAKSAFDTSKDKVDRASNVVIIGGGPVGLEFAGEIRDRHNNVNITVLQRGDILGADFGDSFQNKLRSHLKEMNINVKYSAAKDLPMDEIAQARGLLDGKRTIQLEDGSSIEADLVAWCVGNKNNNGALPEAWLNEMGQVIVEDTLLVKSTSSVFAVGDINDVKETKLAYLTQFQAAVVASNVGSVLEGKQPEKKYRPSSSAFMAIPLGQTHGVTTTPLMNLGNWATSKIKGGSLFTGRYWPLFAGVKTLPASWEKRMEMEKDGKFQI